MRTRTGKIARLPHSIRKEINRRLRDGHPGKAILSWLNELPETKRVLSEWFPHQRQLVDDENLRSWRQGGYRDDPRKPIVSRAESPKKATDKGTHKRSEIWGIIFQEYERSQLPVT